MASEVYPLAASPRERRIDLQRQIVEHSDGRREKLTTREVELLRYLMAHADRTISRDELLANVWRCADGVVTRAVDHTVRRLRVKVEADPADPEYLLTVFGDGYRWNDEGTAQEGTAHESPAQESAKPEQPSPVERLRLTDRVVDIDRARVESADGLIALTGSEITLLRLLIEANGVPIDRDHLQRAVWGSARGRAVENAVYRLRRKLEADPASPVHLLTTPTGYRLDLPEVPSPMSGSATLPLVPPDLDLRFGRDAQIAEIIEMLQNETRRCVSVVGPGGIGKTRVAMAVARAWTGRPVVTVDLVGAATVQAAVASIAARLRLPLAAASSEIDQLGFAIDAIPGPLLVVLDNVEQLVPLLAEPLARWMMLALRCRFLLTSRRPTGVTGEQRLPLGPLPAADATALFEARAIRPPAPGDPALQTLIAALDGSPLALELAAARTSTLTVAEQIERLDTQLRLLSGGPSDRPERHRSLRASLAVSWGLASEAARAALSQLAVFVGRFTAGQAEDVLELAPWGVEWPVDILQELVEASLLDADERGRMKLAVPVREFASEPAHMAQAIMQQAQRRHGQWAAGIARRALAQLDSSEEPEALAVLAEIRDELSAAVRRAGRCGERSVAATGALAIWATVRVTGPYPMAAELLDVAAAIDPNDSALGIARAEVALATSRVPDAIAVLELIGADVVATETRSLATRYWCARSAAEAAARRLDEAHTSAARALAIARAEGDPAQIGWALVALCELDIDGRDVTPIIEEAIEHASTAGAPRLDARVRRYLGWIWCRRGETERGRAELARAQQLARAIGDRGQAALALLNALQMSQWLGQPGTENLLEGVRREFSEIGDHSREIKAISLRAGHHNLRCEYALAEQGYQEALAVARRIGLEREEAQILTLLGSTLVHLGRPTEGESAMRRGIALLAAHGLHHQVHTTQANLARALRKQGRHPEARALYDGSLAWFRANACLRDEILVLSMIGAQHRQLGEIDRAEEVFLCVREKSRAGGFRHLAATSTLDLADLVRRQGDIDRAEALLSEADMVFIALGDPTKRREVQWVRSQIAAARSASPGDTPAESAERAPDEDPSR